MEWTLLPEIQMPDWHFLLWPEMRLILPSGHLVHSFSKYHWRTWSPSRSSSSLTHLPSLAHIRHDLTLTFLLLRTGSSFFSLCSWWACDSLVTNRMWIRCPVWLGGCQKWQGGLCLGPPWSVGYVWTWGCHAVRKPKPGHVGRRRGEALRALREGEAGQARCSSRTWPHPRGDLTPCHTRVCSCPFLQACALAVLAAAHSRLDLILISPHHPSLQSTGFGCIIF